MPGLEVSLKGSWLSLSGLPTGGDLGRHRMEQLGTWADSARSRA